MAEELQFSSRSDNKRKYDDQNAVPPSATAPAPARRATGFSAPIALSSPDNHAAAPPPPSYNNVPPPPDGFQLAKQRAQEIAARLLSDAEAKRPRVENGGGTDDSNGIGFASAASDHFSKPPGQQIPNPQVGLAPPAPFPTYGYQGSSKKIDIPNGRVGVIIGKGGETIKYLQLQSGAKIQVTRDMDADPNSQTRLVELTGTSEQISKAEQLISDVLSEAEAGGSGIVTARRFGGGQVGTEQFTMEVPNNKVGLIIGKGGETIKNMQARSGARIQLIPLHLPAGDTSTERTVQMEGTKEQIESAKELVNEVISENRVRNPSMAGGYSQQGYRPPRPPTSWGPSGAPPMQQPGYGYMQPGAYPGQAPQYNMSQPSYGGYPPPASGGFSSGWDQSSNPPTQQTMPGAGYDYYNQQQQQQQQPSLEGSTPADNSSYNYGQPPPSYSSQGSYGDSAYTQAPPSGQQQGYGQDSYPGGYQAPSNPQGGYEQQGYGSTPAYGAMTNPTQDGSAPTYGAPGGSTQVPSSQQAPSTVQPPGAQQGYTQQSSTIATSYPSQGTGQHGYGMPPTSQPGYGQPGPISQPSYVQPPHGQTPSPTQAVYGQAQQAPTNQSGYIQPAPVQPAYSHAQPAQSGYVQDSAHHRTPSSGYGSGAPQPAYGQQQSYGGTPPPSQPGYGQQKQQAYESYSGGGYSQPPVYSNDNAVHAGTYDAPAAAQPAPTGVTKASPQS